MVPYRVRFIATTSENNFCVFFDDVGRLKLSPKNNRWNEGSGFYDQRDSIWVKDTNSLGMIKGECIAASHNV